MKRAFGILLVVLLVVGLFALPLAAQETPTVEVEDQTVQDSTVTIKRVVAIDPGWIVIHIDQDGKPGPIIGYAAVPAGESTNVKVKIDVAKATNRLWAMLHVDAGTVGTFEVPGPDKSVKVEGQTVMAAFNVTLPVLPTTGGQTFPAGLWLVIAGAVLAVAGLAVWRFGRQAA